MSQDQLPQNSPEHIPIFNKEVASLIKNYNAQPHIAVSMDHILGEFNQVLEDITASFVVDGADYCKALTMMTVISNALEEGSVLKFVADLHFHHLETIVNPV